MTEEGNMPLSTEGQPLIGESAEAQQYAGEDEPGPNANRRIEIDYQDTGTHNLNPSHTETSVESAAPETVEPGSVMPTPEMSEDEWRQKNWPNAEQDVEKAHDMALAGDSARSKAAEQREGLRILPEFQREYKEILEDPNYFLPKKPWRRKDAVSPEAQRRLDELDREKWTGRFSTGGPLWEMARGDHNLIEHAELEVETGETYPELEYARERLLDRARYLDERAERQEAWAGWLHDHPISEEYKKAHPDFGFGVNTLIELEKVVSQDEERKPFREKAWHNELAKFDKPESRDLIDLGNEIERRLQDLHDEGQEHPEHEQEFVELMKNGSTTLDQLVGFYKKLVEQSHQKAEAKINESRQILEDIKNGRTGQTPHTPESQVAA